MRIFLSQLIHTAVFLLLVACSTPSLRSPAQLGSDNTVSNKMAYRYTSELNCTNQITQLSPRGIQTTKPTKWSALTGLPLGSKFFQTWDRNDHKILRPFTSDGCSKSPDGMLGSDQNEKWTHCCVEHDTTYWLGGAESDKQAADQRLNECISQTGHSKIGNMYQFFVNKYGGPENSSTYRWGYGWNYKRSFGPLSNEEESQVRDLYERNSSDLKEQLKNSFNNLTKVCDSKDYGLENISNYETAIYHLLSNKVRNPDIIEWAKLDNNSKSVAYIIKLQSCPTPVALIFNLNDAANPELRSNSCDNLQ